ncbi:MAG: MFS transporter [Candidatus Hodarchaeales archaeon]|jgi:MFS family permease
MSADAAKGLVKDTVDTVLSPITLTTAILRGEKTLSQKNRNMIAIGLYGFASALVVSLVITYYNTLYLRGMLEIEDTLANSIFSYSTAAGAIGMLLAVIIGGAYSDDFRSKYGARAPFMLAGTIIAGLMLFSIPIIATIFPRGALIFLFPLAFALAYAGLGLGSSPTNALLSELFTKEQRGWVGLVIAGFTTIGSFVGIVGLKAVAETFYTTMMFPFTGTVVIIIGISIFFLVEKVNPPFDPIDETIEDIIKTPQYLVKYGGKDFGKMMVVQSLWGFAVASISLYMIIHLTTPAAIAALGEGNEGMVLIVTGIVAAIMAIPAGFAIKKFGKVNTALAGSVFYGLYCFIFGAIEIGGYFDMLIPIAAIGGLGAILIESVRVSLPADLVPEGKEAQFMGINKFASTWTQPVVAILGAQIIVVFANSYPTTIIFNLAGIAAILASLVLFMINYEKMLKHEYQHFYKRYVRAKGIITDGIGDITDGFMSKFT